jgi:hypothetical protein
MEIIIIGISIILIGFTNFYRGVPARCCRAVPDMSWDDRREKINGIESERGQQPQSKSQSN